MNKIVYNCDKCGKPMPDDYDPQEEKLRIVTREIVRFVGPPKCISVEKDICLFCLSKALREWLFNRDLRGKMKDGAYTFDFSLAKEFSELLEKED